MDRGEERQMVILDGEERGGGTVGVFSLKSAFYSCGVLMCGALGHLASLACFFSRARLPVSFSRGALRCAPDAFAPVRPGSATAPVGVRGWGGEAWPRLPLSFLHHLLSRSCAPPALLPAARQAASVAGAEGSRRAGPCTPPAGPGRPRESGDGTRAIEASSTCARRGAQTEQAERAPLGAARDGAQEEEEEEGSRTRNAMRAKPRQTKGSLFLHRLLQNHKFKLSPWIGSL